MKTLYLELLGIVAAALIAGVTGVGAWNPGRTLVSLIEPQDVRPVDAPNEWIAFDGRWVQRFSNGRGINGRYFQSNDGSKRSESGPEGAPAQLITIHNIARSRYFTFVNGRWRSYIMRLPADGYRPGPNIKGGPIELEHVSEPVLGYDVVRVVRSGTEHFQAPRLNFLALREVSAGGRLEYTDIQIRPQPADLFLPPADASVEDTGQLGGIVTDVNRAEAEAIERRRQSGVR